ncbi:methyltransferase [Mycobacterium sp. 1274761.0]|uniref:methyltransferase n=1 Tax=Mycobacterium sp. 1274761.0 TaxID=1834077 RepID=UPI0012E95ED7
MLLGDLNMMVNTGGRQRTRAEFERLCRSAGFTVHSVKPLPPPVASSVLEATPAP